MADDTYDIICFKSVLGVVGRLNQIDRQQEAIHRFYKALKPGGMLICAENLKASWLHQVLRREFVKWGKIWRYVSLKEMDEFLQDFWRVHYKTFGFFAGFGRTERQRRLLGKVDRVVNPLIPKSWRYIGFFVCIK